jgi:hypothetical protein
MKKKAWLTIFNAILCIKQSIKSIGCQNGHFANGGALSLLLTQDSILLHFLIMRKTHRSPNTNGKTGSRGEISWSKNRSLPSSRK